MTTLDAAVTALVAVYTAAAPTGATGVEVFDSGPPIDPNLNWLCIGFSGNDEPAINVACGDSKSPAMRNRESVDVTSVLSFWRGDQHQSPVAVRTAVLTAFGLLRDAVRADRTLGHVVTDAEITEYDLDQDASSLGDVATVRFTTHLDLF